MRTTITIDDELIEEAWHHDDPEAPKNISALVTRALKLLVEHESRKRLLKLSGKAPEFSITPRTKRGVSYSEVSGFPNSIVAEGDDS